MVAIGGDVVIVPFLGLDLHWRGLDGADEAAGIKTLRLIIPDLQLITGDMRLPFFLRAQENAAVHFFAAAKLEFELVIGEHLSAGEPAGARSGTYDCVAFDFP